MARKPVIVGFISRKGGVGKTTLAVNVAAAWVEAGRTVELLDIDFQLSAKTWASAGAGVLSRIVRPALGDLARLREAVGRSTAEIIVIDSPPSFANAAIAAAMIADVAVIPCWPTPLDLASTRETLGVVDEAREGRGGKPRIFLAPNMVTGSRLGKELPDALRDLRAPVLPAIRRRAGLASSALRGLAIVEAAPRSAGADEVRALSAAILRRSR